MKAPIRLALFAGIALLMQTARIDVLSVHAQEGKIVPYVPTPQEVVDRMLDLAQIKKGDVVYDLGSGDGRIVVTAAKNSELKPLGSRSTRSGSKNRTRISKKPASKTWSKSANRIFARSIFLPPVY